MPLARIFGNSHPAGGTDLQACTSLIDQSLHSRLGAVTTNGDGFGIGWYAEGEIPSFYRSAEPAWSDRNLREVTPVQQTNCHPFRHGRWLWMHNGSIARFPELRRELALEVDPLLYVDIEGSTDSEVFFFLALTLGLEQDPPAAVERAVGLIERVGRSHGVQHPVQMTVATSDGQSLWTFRYSSENRSRSLFYTTRMATLRAQYPDNPALHEHSDVTRLVVSEPLTDLAGAWNEVPESSCGVIHHGHDELKKFTPRL